MTALAAGLVGITDLEWLEAEIDAADEASLLSPPTYDHRVMADTQVRIDALDRARRLRRIRDALVADR